MNDVGASVSVRFATADGFRVLSTEELFTPLGLRSEAGRVMYDPAPDGQRFLGVDLAAVCGNGWLGLNDCWVHEPADPAMYR